MFSSHTNTGNIHEKIKETYKCIYNYNKIKIIAYTPVHIHNLTDHNPNFFVCVFENPLLGFLH